MNPHIPTSSHPHIKRLRRAQVPYDNAYLARGENLLSCVVMYALEQVGEGFDAYPFAQLGGGAGGEAVGEVAEGQFLEAEGTNSKIVHRGGSEGLREKHGCFSQKAAVLFKNSTAAIHLEYMFLVAFGHRGGGILLEPCLFTRSAQLLPRAEHNPRRADERRGERLFVHRPAGAYRHAEIADLSELHDAPGAEVLVHGVVHAVENRLHVCACERAMFGDFRAKLVEAYIAVVHCLGIQLARVRPCILSQVLFVNQFKFNSHTIDVLINKCDDVVINQLIRSSTHPLIINGKGSGEAIPRNRNAMPPCAKVCISSSVSVIGRFKTIHKDNIY